jgi:hypothetical protein
VQQKINVVRCVMKDGVIDPAPASRRYGAHADHVAYVSKKAALHPVLDPKNPGQEPGCMRTLQCALPYIR